MTTDEYITWLTRIAKNSCIIFKMDCSKCLIVNECGKMAKDKPHTPFTHLSQIISKNKLKQILFVDAWKKIC